MYEQKDNTGVLFINEKKSEKSPDLSGNFKINGKVYKLAAWKKEGQKGEYYSLKVSDNDQPKDEALPF
jgi:hypothetical protein